ncbi:hypothetical protein C8F01DRAFT_1084461 [Mycena amicta]|nr:hypothetical protein C8F01DRAFT_1084461 [Mycena amicta]
MAVILTRQANMRQPHYHPSTTTVVVERLPPRGMPPVTQSGVLEVLTGSSQQRQHGQRGKASNAWYMAYRYRQRKIARWFVPQKDPRSQVFLRAHTCNWQPHGNGHHNLPLWQQVVASLRSGTIQRNPTPKFLAISYDEFTAAPLPRGARRGASDVSEFDVGRQQLASWASNTTKYGNGKGVTPISMDTVAPLLGDAGHEAVAVWLGPAAYTSLGTPVLARIDNAGVGHSISNPFNTIGDAGQRY